MIELTSIEICAGGGGQALGLEEAGFKHVALVEMDKNSCATLRGNRPNWNVLEGDVRSFDASGFRGVDLLAGGVPCPPFSVAGRQHGERDERNLFPEAIRLVDECRPRAVMIENVPGILERAFDEYRNEIDLKLGRLGYAVTWRVLNACNFGVSQLRPRVVLVGLRKNLADDFGWPLREWRLPPTVGELLHDQMASRGWKGADAWRERANKIAPTIVGGSLKHGGPDLGPTRAKQAWAALGVDGHGIANEPPEPGFVGMPRLTIPMVSRLQGFPDDWRFAGRKTHAYRQVGNAFPPPVARAVGEQITACLGVNRQAKVAG